MPPSKLKSKRGGGPGESTKSRVRSFLDGRIFTVVKVRFLSFKELWTKLWGWL